MATGPSSPCPPGAAVLLRNVRRAFSGRPAVGGIDLEVPSGELIALLGPSGCGKSTLLRLIAGLDPPDDGTILLDGALPLASARLSFVFQDPHLLPWRTVLDNVALPLELRGVAAQARADEARAMLQLTGLSDADRLRPAALSGGMRMRVSLARALITQPRLLLLDEPFAAVDELTRQALDDRLRALWAANGMTVIFVTHSVAEATYLADRAVVFSPRPARVIHDERVELPNSRTPELRVTPAFARVQRRLFDALAGAGG
jgi:NitT/TauT family transport system ATP-binding protein